LAPNFHIPSQLAAKFTPKYLVLFSTLGTLKTDDAKSVGAFRISWSTTRVGANPIVSQSQAAAATAAHPSLAPLLLAACTSDSTHLTDSQYHIKTQKIPFDILSEHCFFSSRRI
jgi:hypothetical protein